MNPFYFVRFSSAAYNLTTAYNNLRPRGSRLPHMYGLPKVHKQGIPHRPILSIINSPYHKVARWLADESEPVRQRLATYT
ncbi:unnamed protein product [Schistosoma curassoni]|uniref:Uncharacterized protein n=1 Tax=Schistosoma curassoni TaxID=6186 RepID=A0A183K1M0_9TREM|nr:unnamed protein product [Schistosoma curassoni]